MKGKPILKTLLTISIAGIFADRCAPIVSAELTYYLHSPIKKENANNPVEFKRDENLSALEYLVLANSISSNTISINNDCKGYAIETFRTYKRLISEDKRTELNDEVRLAFGDVIVERKDGLHVWTEVKLDGKWQPYETTNPIDSISNNQYLRYLAKTREMTEGYSDYYAITTRQADQRITRPNPRWFYERPGELKELYKIIKELLPPKE